MTNYLGNSIQTWAIGAMVAAGAVIFLLAVRRLLVRRLGKIADATETPVDDLLLLLLSKTRYFFFAVIGLYAGSHVVELPDPEARIVSLTVALGTLLQTALWGNGAITFLLRRAMKKRVEEDAGGATTLAVIGIVAKIALWSVLLLLALDNLDVNITGLVAGLGIGGIAVALAVQNILGDLFASLSIALDKPFVIGDFIVVDDIRGSIERIGLKTTRIRSLSGEQIVFSNADLLNSRIRNFKRMQERRIEFSVGVTYQTPYDKLAGIGDTLKAIIESESGTRFDRAHFKGYSDSSLTFEVVYFVGSPEYNVYMDIQQRINLEIYRRFEEEGIEFAYPTRTLYVRRGADEELDLKKQAV